MKDIDEFSRTLGVIQADVGHIRKNTDAIEKKVDKTHEDMIINKASTKSAHKRIDDITPHIEDFKKIKQRGIGITSILSIIFGFLGAILLKTFHFLLG